MTPLDSPPDARRQTHPGIEFGYPAGMIQRHRRGPKRMPDFAPMTFAQLREIGKQAHLLVSAYDAGQANPTEERRVDAFKSRIESLREALYGR